jgi:hypothetical protein
VPIPLLVIHQKVASSISDLFTQHGPGYGQYDIWSDLTSLAKNKF